MRLPKEGTCNWKIICFPSWSSNWMIHKNNINCVEHRSKRVHAANHPNGRDYGIYNREGCIFRGSTSVILHYPIRITSFKL